MTNIEKLEQIERMITPLLKAFPSVQVTTINPSVGSVQFWMDIPYDKPCEPPVDYRNIAKQLYKYLATIIPEYRLYLTECGGDDAGAGLAYLNEADQYLVEVERQN